MNRTQVTRITTKQGTITIADKTIYVKSGWEANVAAYYQFLKEQGQIADWEYEPKTFWFEKILRGVRSYKPDFRISEKNGGFTYIEVKGYMDAKSQTKLKRMAKYYPDVTIEVIDKKRYTDISRNKGLFKWWGLLEKKD